jgi:hypothetical protein
MGDRNRQAGRLLAINEVAMPSSETVWKILPENLESKDRPRMLEVADLMTYSAARTLAKEKKKYDDVFEALIKIMRPPMNQLKWLPAEQ